MSQIELSTKTPGGRLRKLRLHHGLTVDQLGEKLFIAGNTVTCKELGYRSVSERDYKHLAQNTDFDVDWIRSGS